MLKLGCRVDSRLSLHRVILCTRRSVGTAKALVLPERMGGATSQLDLPSLTPLGVLHWATSVDYCK